MGYTSGPKTERHAVHLLMSGEQLGGIVGRDGMVLGSWEDCKRIVRGRL